MKNKYFITQKDEVIGYVFFINQETLEVDKDVILFILGDMKIDALSKIKVLDSISHVQDTNLEEFMTEFISEHLSNE